MKVIWIGQSGYILKSGSSEIILDPYLSDAVICTHNHIDRLDTYFAAKSRICFSGERCVEKTPCEQKTA